MNWTLLTVHLSSFDIDLAMPFTRPPRQTHLARSRDGLCIWRPPPLVARRTGPCVIETLPIEILTQILHIVKAAEDQDHAPGSVNKLWQAAYKPVICHTIELNGSAKRKATRYHNHLHQTFKQNVALGSLVRKLDLLLDKVTDERRALLADVVALCTGLKSLSIDSMTNDIEPIYEATRNLSRLEDCRAGYRDLNRGGLPLSMVVTNLARCPLKTLYLSRLGLGAALTPQRRHFYERELDATVMENMLQATYTLLKDIPHSSIEKLTLCEPYAPPAVIELLVAWPRALLSIEFRSLNFSPLDYNSHHLQKILDTQHRTLRKISIGNYGRLGGRSIPDFCFYPCLRDLHISMYNLLEERPSNAATKLSSPQLSYIRGDFATEDQHQARWNAFEQGELDWMRQFIGYRDVSGARLAALQSIEIHLHPDPPYSGEDIEWPWEYLEKAKEVVEKEGVEFVSEPSWTRGRWRRLIDEGEGLGEEDESDEDDESSESGGSESDDGF